MEKKNVEYYSKLIAKKYNLPRKQVHAVLMYFMKNMIESIKKGDDIRLPKFGHIFTDKKLFVKYLKKNEGE